MNDSSDTFVKEIRDEIQSIIDDWNGAFAWDDDRRDWMRRLLDLVSAIDDTGDEEVVE